MDLTKIQWENKIGVGATADIYAYGNNQAIKIFHADKMNSANQEYHIQKAVNQTPLPVPKVYEYVNQDGICGYVMDRIQGKTLLEQMLTPNEDIEKIMYSFINLQHQVHTNCNVAGIVDAYNKFSWIITLIQELTPREVDTIKKLLDRQEKETVLCHMDFHPGNVIETENGLCLLDWMDAVNGNHYADAARTSLVFLSDEVPSDVSLETAATILSLKKELNHLYQKELSKLEPLDETLLNQWQVIVAACRLPWAKEEEKEMLCDLIRDRI